MGLLGMCTSRTILGFLGLLFFASGLACMVIGIKIVSLDFKVLQSFENVHLLCTPAYLLIFAGIVFFVAGISGCCNLFNENKGCLASFFVFLFLVVSLMITALVMGSMYRDKLTDGLNQSLNETLEKYESDNATRTQVDNLQEFLKCCGIHNASDWKLSSFGQIPDSCKVNRTDTESTVYYTEGCYTKIKQFFDQNFGYIVSGTVVLLLIFVLGMSGSCAMFWYKRHDTYFTLS